MSAINDALRRASGAAAGTAEPPPLPTELPHSPNDLPPLRVDHSIFVPAGDAGLPPLLQPPPAKKGFAWIVVVIVLLFCAGGAAGFFLWQRNRTRAATVNPSTSGEATVRTDVQKQPVVANTKLPEKANTPERPATAAVSETRAVTSAAPVTVATPVVPALPPRNVQFPQLRLQGIYFRPSNPSVMINNRTLFLGDQVQGVTIAAIDASSVTLVLSGQTNVLTLR